MFLLGMFIRLAVIYYAAKFVIFLFEAEYEIRPIYDSSDEIIDFEVI